MFEFKGSRFYDLPNPKRFNSSLTFFKKSRLRFGFKLKTVSLQPDYQYGIGNRYIKIILIILACI